MVKCLTKVKNIGSNPIISLKFKKRVFKIKGYIYLVENKINDKKYVGKTYGTIEKRWNEHIKDSKRNNKQHRPLYRAIRKYGVENFFISELEYVDNCEEREIYWINFYDCYKNGYNATLGGDGKTYFEHSDKDIIEKYKELKTVKDVALFFVVTLIQLEKD